jgi:hypothetical protein
VVVLWRSRWRDPWRWVLLILAAGGGLLSLGPSLPLLGKTPLAPFTWLSALPGLDGIRAPARFAMLGAGGLVALAVDALAGNLGPKRQVMLVALVPLMLAE